MSIPYHVTINHVIRCHVTLSCKWIIYPVTMWSANASMSSMQIMILKALNYSCHLESLLPRMKPYTYTDPKQFSLPQQNP